MASLVANGCKLLRGTRPGVGLNKLGSRYLGKQLLEQAKKSTQQVGVKHRPFSSHQNNINLVNELIDNGVAGEASLGIGKYIAGAEVIWPCQVGAGDSITQNRSFQRAVLENIDDALKGTVDPFSYGNEMPQTKENMKTYIQKLTPQSIDWTRWDVSLSNGLKTSLQTILMLGKIFVEKDLPTLVAFANSYPPTVNAALMQGYNLKLVPFALNQDGSVDISESIDRYCNAAQSADIGLLETVNPMGINIPTEFNEKITNVLNSSPIGLVIGDFAYPEVGAKLQNNPLLDLDKPVVNAYTISKMAGRAPGARISPLMCNDETFLSLLKASCFSSTPGLSEVAFNTIVDDGFLDKNLEQAHKPFEHAGKLADLINKSPILKDHGISAINPDHGGFVRVRSVITSPVDVQEQFVAHTENRYGKTEAIGVVTAEQMALAHQLYNQSIPPEYENEPRLDNELRLGAFKLDNEDFSGERLIEAMIDKFSHFSESAVLKM